MSSYAEQEQDAREYVDLQNQFEQERLLEPTEPYDKGYLLVDDNQVEEPVGFHSIDGAVAYASALGHDYYSVFQLKKVF